MPAIRWMSGLLETVRKNQVRRARMQQMSSTPTQSPVSPGRAMKRPARGNGAESEVFPRLTPADQLLAASDSTLFDRAREFGSRLAVIQAPIRNADEPRSTPGFPGSGRYW